MILVRWWRSLSSLNPFLVAGLEERTHYPAAVGAGLAPPGIPGRELAPLPASCRLAPFLSVPICLHPDSVGTIGTFAEARLLRPGHSSGTRFLCPGRASGGAPRVRSDIPMGSLRVET